MFRRSGSANWSSWAKHRDKLIRMSWRSPDRSLAKRMEAMWERLASGRHWDLLDPVVDGQVSVGSLFDRYEESKGDVSHLRSNMADVDVASFMLPFLTAYATSGVGRTRVKQVEAHLTWMLRQASTHQLVNGNTTPAATRPVSSPSTGAPLSSVALSTLTSAALATWISAYPYPKPGTLRKVHSSLSVFFSWLAKTHNLPCGHLMDTISRPKNAIAPVRFYEIEQVRNICEHSPSELLPLIALMYGTGSEISASLAIEATDFRDDFKTVRVTGTKERSRDRICRIAEWARPLVRAGVWPAQFDRWQVAKAHRAVTDKLGLPSYPLYNSRHHWAVMRLRAGFPIALVQQQLGHAKASTTLNYYGRFIPSATDVDNWEAKL